MAITFALELVVPFARSNERDSFDAYESDNSCEAETSKISIAEFGSSEALLFVSASSVSMSLNRQRAATEKSHVSHLGIFVPPTLLASTNIRDLGTPTCSKQVRVIKDETVGEKLSSDLLNSIHPFLLEHGKLVGIVSACREQQEQSTPADLVLIDVSNAPQHWLHDIKASLNGEPMASLPTVVIKLIPVSSIVMATGTSVSSSASKTPSRVPSCPVCLHRIDPSRLGMPKPQNHQLCSKFCPGAIADGLAGDVCRNQQFLRPWSPPSNCIACHVIHDRWENYLAFTVSNEDHDQKDDLFCNQCAMQETLWVCLTCGFVGCGRYSHKHAEQHYEESGHPYSLELATLRIWDYADGEFVQRGDLLECPSVQRAVGHGHGGEQPFDSDGFTDTHRMDHHMAQPTFMDLDMSPPKKANMIGEEYEALLQSALEDQAQHYEGEITRLRAEVTAENVDAQAITEEEAKEISDLRADVSRFRTEIDRLSRQLLDAQALEAGYKAASQRLLREQSVAKDLLDKIKEEATRESIEGEMQVDDLEQQLADLTANLKMRRRFSQDNELSNSQIFGTTSSTSKLTKRGKKLRRRFRK